MLFLIFIAVITISTILLAISSKVFKNEKSNMRTTIVMGWPIVNTGVSLWFLWDWQSNLIDFYDILTSS